MAMSSRTSSQAKAPKCGLTGQLNAKPLVDLREPAEGSSDADVLR